MCHQHRQRYTKMPANGHQSKGRSATTARTATEIAQYEEAVDKEVARNNSQIQQEIDSEGWRAYLQPKVQQTGTLRELILPNVVRTIGSLGLDGYEFYIFGSLARVIFGEPRWSGNKAAIEASIGNT